jgi:adenylate cyclase
MFNKLLKNNIFLTFFVWIIVFSIIWIFSIFLSNIDKNLSDKLYSTFVSKNLKISKDIILIAIDEKSVWDENLGRFPFSRDKYIKLINNLNSAWVSIIWFDIIFADKTDKIIDKNFAKSIE